MRDNNTKSYVSITVMQNRVAAGWIDGADAIRTEAVRVCDTVIRLLETGAIDGSALEVMRAVRGEVYAIQIPLTSEASKS